MIDLSFKNVSKRYRIREEAGDEKTNILIRKVKTFLRPAQDFWALRDVSFSVAQGETLGIIGHNGAGKSTILKLLANITSPSDGELVINGRLAALIEVGSGFHPELTGRENIYLNGSIMGMSRREIRTKFEQIVEFAGVAKFIDVPVKRFSSGMYVRLGFSIAAHLNPHILLLDEVLAVGDAAFQAKCLNRIMTLKNAGTTIVFISHDLAAVKKICDRVLLLDKGTVRGNGPAAEVIHEYETHFAVGLGQAINVEGSNTAKISGLAFFDFAGNKRLDFMTGDSLVARVEIEVREPIADAVVDILFYTDVTTTSIAGNLDTGIQFEFSTENHGPNISLNPGRWAVEFHCRSISLKPGVYFTEVSIRHRGGFEFINIQYKSTILRVEGSRASRGNVFLPHEWKLSELKSELESDVNLC